MNISKVIEVKNYSKWVVKSKNNIYVQGQSGRVWNKILVEKLTSSAFRSRQSKVEICVFHRGKIIYILYTNNSILTVPDEK